MKVEWQCNQFRIRRPATWRHRTSDHSTRHRPLPIPIGDRLEQKLLSPALFEILASKSIWVTTLTFQGHGTSLVTWPFDSQVAISYAPVTESLTPAIFKILMDTKHMGVTTLTIQGHMTSAVTWPFDSQVAISYAPVTESLSPAIFKILMDTKHMRVTTLTIQGHMTSAVTWPFDSQVDIFL